MKEVYEHKKFEKIIKIVGLQDVINSLPKGELTPLDNVSRLSSGEKQRLCIARALYKSQTELFIMDEATSAIDPASEITIINSLAEYIKEKQKMLIWISHNENMRLYADEVYKFD